MTKVQKSNSENIIIQRSTIWISTPLKNLLKMKTIGNGNKSISDIAEEAIMQVHKVDIKAKPIRRG